MNDKRPLPQPPSSGNSPRSLPTPPINSTMQTPVNNATPPTTQQQRKRISPQNMSSSGRASPLSRTMNNTASSPRALPAIPQPTQSPIQTTTNVPLTQPSTPGPTPSPIPIAQSRPRIMTVGAGVIRSPNTPVPLNITAQLQKITPPTPTTTKEEPVNLRSTFKQSKGTQIFNTAPNHLTEHVVVGTGESPPVSRPASKTISTNPNIRVLQPSLSASSNMIWATIVTPGDTSKLHQQQAEETTTCYSPDRIGTHSLLTKVGPYPQNVNQFDKYVHEYLYSIADVNIKFSLIQRLFPGSMSEGINFMRGGSPLPTYSSSASNISKKQTIQPPVARTMSEPIAQPQPSPKNPQEIEWDKWLDDAENDITFNEDGFIKAGTLESILYCITNQKFASPACLNAFLLTYRSFTTPPHLLELLIVRFNVREPREHASNQEFLKYFEERKKKPIQIRTCNTIRKWIDTHWYDFQQNPQLIDRLLSWVKGPLCKSEYSSTSESLEKLITKKREGYQKKKIKYLDNIPSPIVPKTDNFIDFSPKEVARQLALIEFEDYALIHPTECMHQSWTKQDKEKLSPHIGQMIKRSNIVPMWVATQILMQGEKIKGRVKTITLFIKIAKECNQLNNFNAVMEIIAGLQLAPIHRLKKTWELVPKKHLETLSSLKEMMTVTDNWKLYRQTLKQRDPPCIPYLGMYLTDLTFIEDGHPDFLSEPGEKEMINFVKCRQLAVVIQDIQQYQQKCYSFKKVPTILAYLQRLEEHKTNDELYQVSLEVEPRTPKPE